MDRTIISRHAYLVLRTLDNNRTWTFPDLKRATKLDDCELFTAIGWLAHEGSICFCTMGGECRLSLGMNMYI